MKFLRKITRSKWSGCDEDVTVPLKADAVTSCLRTNGNTLSLWSFQSDDAINKAKVALIGSLQVDDKIDVIIVEESELKECGLELKHTPENGRTAAPEFADLHHDLVSLDADSLIQFGKLVQKKLVEQKDVRIARKEIRELVNLGIQENWFDETQLSEKLRKLVRVEQAG